MHFKQTADLILLVLRLLLKAVRLPVPLLLLAEVLSTGMHYNNRQSLSQVVELELEAVPVRAIKLHNLMQDRLSLLLLVQIEDLDSVKELAQSVQALSADSSVRIEDERGNQNQQSLLALCSFSA
jgi:hypothetical protein